jgi:hypothetical protein
MGFINQQTSLGGTTLWNHFQWTYPPSTVHRCHQSIIDCHYPQVIKHGNRTCPIYRRFSRETPICRGFPIAMFDYQRVFLPFTGRLPLQPLTWWAKELLMMLAAADDFVVSLDISFFGRCNPPPATWVCPSIWYPASSALWLLWCFVYTMFLIISAPKSATVPNFWTKPTSQEWHLG